MARVQSPEAHIEHGNFFSSKRMGYGMRQQFTVDGLHMRLWFTYVHNYTIKCINQYTKVLTTWSFSESIPQIISGCILGLMYQKQQLVSQEVLNLPTIVKQDVV